MSCELWTSVVGCLKQLRRRHERIVRKCFEQYHCTPKIASQKACPKEVHEHVLKSVLGPRSPRQRREKDDKKMLEKYNTKKQLRKRIIKKHLLRYFDLDSDL